MFIFVHIYMSYKQPNHGNVRLLFSPGIQSPETV